MKTRQSPNLISTSSSSSVVVRISKNNYDKIVSHGKFGDTFDDVLSRFLDEVEKKK